MTTEAGHSSARPAPQPNRWQSPIILDTYDRGPDLTAVERRTLAVLSPAELQHRRRTDLSWPPAGLQRLVIPLMDALAGQHKADNNNRRRQSSDAAALILLRCARLGRSFWGWGSADWAALLGSNGVDFRSSLLPGFDTHCRAITIALAYQLGQFTDFHLIGKFNRKILAECIFGADATAATERELATQLSSWGYQADPGRRGRRMLSSALWQVLLVNRSPLVSDLTTEAFVRLRNHPATLPRETAPLFAMQRAAAALGRCQAPVRAGLSAPYPITDTSPEWAHWVDRWYQTSTLTPRVRKDLRAIMAKVGRWLAREQPRVTDPADWTRQTCAAWVAAIDRMQIGEFTQRPNSSMRARAGDPVAPRTKVGMLVATRVFFRDCQEWQWIPRRFDPARALATPRSIRGLITTNPRVIADDVWAKLLWAGLNLTPDDLPANASGSYYPMEMIRAITVTWMFSGQRNDEILRLPVGCIRWQHNGFPISGNSPGVLAKDVICLLDVPVHKTGSAFSKPVDPLLGQAIEAWQAVRPAQPASIDRKTGSPVHVLFSVRARAVAEDYINRTVIPALCRKAGVPDSDIRGKITSHRARSTIASQLYNAKEPMTLFELQAWLGHGSPASTQHYARLTPNTLTKAYADAGYFERNVRTIEVLIDRDAVISGAAANGEPWQHYDLGHGWCTYTFFEQCPHRMACARCDFYEPKESSKAQALQANNSLSRMLASIPLTDDERAAVEDDQQALGRLLARLGDTPTPAGPTPNDLLASTRRHLPIRPV